jgi:pimeloyl-ACP methyl ester carboxylesterase
MPEVQTPAGATIHYDVHGPDDGEPLVLIEGLGAHLCGWREGFWTPLVEAGFQVVRFDNRDVGLSQKYPGERYGLVDLAHDTHHLIEALELGPVHVVGQSMGGMVAQALAVHHRKDVQSLALFYTAASVQHLIGDDRDAATLASIPRATTREEAVLRHVEQERVCSSTEYAFDADWKATLGGIMWDRCYDPEGVVRQREALGDVGLDLESLRAVDVPTTLVHGDADRLISPEGSRELHETIPGSELWIVEGMGHELPQELWPRFAERIISNARSAGRAEAERVG